MATHSSILAWRIPWTEEPGRLQSMGSQRVTHDWAHGTEVQFAIRHFSPGCLIGPSNPCLCLKWNLFPQHLPFSMNTITDHAFIQAKNLGSILNSFLMVTFKHQFCQFYLQIIFQTCALLSRPAWFPPSHPTTYQWIQDQSNPSLSNIF